MISAAAFHVNKKVIYESSATGSIYRCCSKSYGPGLHKCARTTVEQYNIVESLRSLSRRHGANPKTIAKWRKRTCGSKERAGTQVHRSFPSIGKPLSLPFAGTLCFNLTISSTLKPHPGVDPLFAPSLPATARPLPAAQRRGRPIPAQEVQDVPDQLLPHPYRGGSHEQGKFYLFVAIDRTSEFAFGEGHPRDCSRLAQALIQLVPYQIHTVLTGNASAFHHARNRCSAAAEIRRALHAFEFACAKPKSTIT